MKHRTRLERAEPFEAAANHLAQGQPLRQGAADLGVARRTLESMVPGSIYFFICSTTPARGL